MNNKKREAVLEHWLRARGKQKKKALAAIDVTIPLNQTCILPRVSILSLSEEEEYKKTGLTANITISLEIVLSLLNLPRRTYAVLKIYAKKNYWLKRQNYRWSIHS